MRTLSKALEASGYALFGIAGLKGLGIHVPLTLLTGLGVLALTASKFLRVPRPFEGTAFGLPKASERVTLLLDRGLPSIMSLVRQADASLTEHQRFEAEVGGGSVPAFVNWLLSGLKAAMNWVPVSLLAMLGGAVLVSPLKLVSGGLGLAQTEAGQWILRQSWPHLVARVTAIEVLGQVYALAGFVGFRALFRRLGFKGRNPEFASAAVIGACCLSFLLAHGFFWMQAAPLLGIQLALVYAYCRSRTLLVPAVANVVLGLASLYSARMVVLLTADLGSIDALPGIPGARGVLAVLGLSLALFAASAAWRFCRKEGWGFIFAEASEQWQRLRSLGLWWSRPADLPGTPLALVPAGMLWGIGIYLASYLSYYAAHRISPSHEAVPPILKQTLLMPFDMLVYVFLIGAALEELIFRKGLFNALFKRIKSGDARVRFWSAAFISAAVFSGFHFIDFGAVLGFLGINASRLIKSLMMVYGFSWAGFIGRVAAGLVLVLIYERSQILLIPIIAHFTSNLLEAVGLRWGLSWFLASVAGIFLLQLLERRRP
ncbi:MAG: CPBP family intramembrane metalloprotease [Elusimicrobia bacterium]|nr:CPBP family intramembrane metalloprotease [Elusimicrobiota bacterium]